MSVKVSTTKLLGLCIGVEEAKILATRFGKWIDSDTAKCPEDWYFGKNAPYSAPKVGNSYSLHHVHTVPSGPALKQWRADYEHGDTKVSDVAIVYARNADDEFLLIALLPKEAHVTAKMASREAKEIMERFALIAQEFIVLHRNN